MHISIAIQANKKLIPAIESLEKALAKKQMNLEIL